MAKWENFPEEKPQRQQQDPRLAEVLQQMAALRREVQEMQDRSAITQGDTKYTLENMDMHKMWQVGGEGNLDSTDPLTTVLNIPSETKQIHRVMLWLKLKEFQAYYTTGAVSAASAKQSGGANWDAGFPDPGQPSVDEHTHTITTPAHAHNPVYAIFFTGMAAGVGVIINGVDVTAALGGPFSADQDSLDITQYVQAIGLNDIQFTCTSERGRIQWGAFVELYLP